MFSFEMFQKFVKQDCETQSRDDVLDTRGYRLLIQNKKGVLKILL